MNTWQVETAGNASFVVRRHRGIQPDFYCGDNDCIVWFESKGEAQKAADRLNADSVKEQPE